MARVALLGGPYQSRSLIASAQKSLNLYPEKNEDPQSPVPVTHYTRSGLDRFSSSETIRATRQLYRSTAGKLYSVVGPNVYAVNDVGAETLLGTIADLNTTVYMADNGLAIVLVDGTATGYAIDMTNDDFGTISDPSFYGANFVVYFDTFFVFNRPDTNQFYISLSFASYAMLVGGTSFDPLDIAAKAGAADNIVGIIALQPYLILVGVLSSEPWYNTGAADFTFGRVAGTFIAHGCSAPYSIANQDIFGFWLEQDLQGHAIIVKLAGAELKRISTHAIEAAISAYLNPNDAIGMCFQQQGHSFYFITFPTDQRTWVYELATEQWHEESWSDENGQQKRHRANCMTFAYGKNLAGDWQNGRIYSLNQNKFTDDGDPIIFTRSFPHMISDGKRVIYNSFIVDIQTGTVTDDSTPQLSLRWSDDRGVTYGNAMMQSFGKQGDYLAQISYNRLGMARDRVFEISWSAPVRTALNGAFVQITKART